MYCVRCGVTLTDKNIDHKARVPYRYEMCKRCYPDFTRKMIFKVILGYSLLLPIVIFAIYLNIKAFQ